MDKKAVLALKILSNLTGNRGSRSREREWGDSLCLGGWRQPTMNACGGGTHLLPLEIIGLCVAGPQSPVFWGPSERKKKSK